MFHLQQSWSPESGVSEQEHTREVEKGADEPSPEVTVQEVFRVWLFKTLWSL